MKMTFQLSRKNMHLVDLFATDLKPGALSAAVENKLINKGGMVNAGRLAGLLRLTGDPLSQIREMIEDRDNRPAVAN
jgi:hypothetical protein